MTNLDQEVDTSLRDLQRRRKTKLALAIAALFVGSAVMLGFTFAMYSSTPAEVDEDRIGEESFM